MSEKQNLSQCVKAGKICFQDFDMEFGSIEIPQCRTIEFTRCIFNHLNFDLLYDFELSWWGAIECEFRHCVFHGDLKECSLMLEDNLFKECQFENIYMENDGQTSYMGNNGFFDCDFINIKSYRDIEFMNQVINGGKMEDVFFISQHMENNQCSDMYMENVEIGACFDHNAMGSVVFKNVTLSGAMGSCGYDTNVFYKCDKGGLKFIRS